MRLRSSSFELYIATCTPSSKSPSVTHRPVGGRLQSSNVVPLASTSKYRVPTIQSGPVVEIQILERAICCTYSARRKRCQSLPVLGPRFAGVHEPMKTFQPSLGL
jgi:hypothetical protein